MCRREQEARKDRIHRQRPCTPISHLALISSQLTICTPFLYVYLIDLSSHHGTHVRKPSEMFAKPLKPEVAFQLSDGDIVLQSFSQCFHSLHASCLRVFRGS